MNTWIHEHLPLDRPEYAKQPESLLTDLLWRSKGSSLSGEIKLSRESSLVRLVPKQRPSGNKPNIVETVPVAETTDASTLLLEQNDVTTPVEALLKSILAPRSRQDKSLACVPVHPDVVALQTLQGLVNKLGPPNLAKIIENVGWLGGSEGEGHVAKSFLEIMYSQTPGSAEYFTSFITTLLPLVAQETWKNLVVSYGEESTIPSSWPGVQPGSIDSTRGKSLLASQHKHTPFRWFWSKWEILCNPENGWYKVLPTRRFVDWATCLLRTGLSFAYLWEANFYVELHSCLVEELQQRKDDQHKKEQTPAIRQLISSLRHGAVLATIESPLAPATQKHAWNAMRSLLSRGYIARKRIEEHLRNEAKPFEISNKVSLDSLILDWLDSLTQSSLEKLSAPLEAEQNAAVNTQEFVRYLLRPRSSDDDTRDQADFYYLALTNSSGSFWFQPGPEWLVVTASLLSQNPGGVCTLKMLLEDLQMLGIKVDRWILVDFLENAGLSTDSPDADNALVIQAGF
ncbi:MAG: hypothetical protein H6650_05235 [Ardenticatenales bacterium]|nr:hypothetical protein [Ardenticatenales bacterium]